MILDNSSSMHNPEVKNLSVDNLNKVGFGVLAIAALMQLLKKQRDAVGLSIYSDSYEFHAPEKSSERHFQMLYSKLNEVSESKEPSKNTKTYTFLHQIAEKIRPTNVPRQDRESSPYSIDHHQITGKIGSVIVGKGIEVQTRIPRFTAVTQASSWPKANPVIEITFAADGVVITAKLLRSSGYAGIDSPILASVYHWKAKGELLEKLNQKFTRKFTFNLIDDEIE